MTSASELFCNRRSRYGRNSVDLSPDSSSSPSSFDRIFHRHQSSNIHDNNRRLNHHSHGSNRRERIDLDGCDLHRRPFYHLRHPINRPSLPERDIIRPDQGGFQASSGNVTNLEESRNVHNSLRVTGNDRLPGDVVLARERLLERLRGVSVSGNRQSHEISFNINNDDYTLHNGNYIGLDDIETENSRDWLAEVTANTYPRAGRLGALQETKKRPSGLTRDVFDCLHVEVFNNNAETSDRGTTSRASRECSICLETFGELDVVTCLPCEHRFHSVCLGPWVKDCGDCPNCRTVIDVSAYKTK